MEHPHAINVHFVQDGESAGWTQKEIATYRAALNSIESMVDVHFNFVTDRASADWLLETFEDFRSYGARAQYPDSLDTQTLKFWRHQAGWSEP
jgi:hypothetical protein